MIHCWEDETQYIVKKHGLDSKEYVDSILRGGGTCMLPDGHTGGHEFTPDGEITILFGHNPTHHWTKTPPVS